VKERNMLPYQQDRKIEKLLENLFGDDDESTLEDVGILRLPGLPRPSYSCCTYNYASFNG
jgi:hypothetical protein